MQALADLKLERVLIEQGSPAAGKNAVDLDLRRQTGALMIAVQRGLALLEQPDPHVHWEVGDVVFLAGTGEAIRKATALLSAPAAEGSPRAVSPGVSGADP
jgi:K+/H+ antiporter YhaU regulatory subunit KhtT